MSELVSVVTTNTADSTISEALSTPELIISHFNSTPNLPDLKTCVRLSGGFANFTFRATTSSGESIIIKHAVPYVATNPDYPIDTIRTYYEHSVMTHLPRFVDGVVVPKALYFTREPTILVMSDAGEETLPLSAALRKRTLRDIDHATVGRRLGLWLAALHTWGRSPAAAPLREVLADNKFGDKTWIDVTYGRLLLGGPFPEVVEPYTELIRAIARRARTSTGDTVSHGDFWCGNTVVNGKTGEVTVHDFEMFKLWEVWGDLGQMSAELYQPFWFEGNEDALVTLKAFLEGYREAVGGHIEKEMVRLAVVHLGVHLICWPSQSGWGEDEETRKCARHGMEFVHRGWVADWWWVRQSVMAPLVDDSW